MNSNDIKNLPEGWFSPRDIETYRALVSQIPKGGVLIELGVWKGRSICSVADIILKNDIKVFAVDTFEGTVNEGDAHKEAKEIDLKELFINNIKEHGLENNVTAIKSLTDDYAVEAPIADMVFIDADHSEEAVTKDIINYTKKLKTNGILSGHDWSWDSTHNAVVKNVPNVNALGNMWFTGELYPGKTFSICFIARNEEKYITRALQSLEGFKRAGGEVCLVDTGSTDNTAQIARDWGCVVEEVGDKFRITVDEKLANDINNFFVEEGEEAVVKAGQSLFDFASARNYSAHLASNDHIMWMDADECITSFDMESINKHIRLGVDQFEYLFTFSHDQYGKADVEFIQSKMHNKSKIQWKGIIHEILLPKDDIDKDTIAPIVRLPQEVYHLEHFQNPETNRGGYLTGLAVDCFKNLTNDRNSHYFARELRWNGRPKSAIKEFLRHLTISWWPAERGQSMIFIGDALIDLANKKK